MVDQVYAKGNGAWGCVICAKSGHLQGPDKDRVVTENVTLHYHGAAKEHFQMWMVPRGCKVTFVRHGDGGWINWAIIGEFDKGSGSHEAHVWIPNWASSPW
jgi:hypothetical protein